jgi:hypothetical protein
MKRASLLPAFTAGMLTMVSLKGQTIDYAGNLDFVPANPAIPRAEVRFSFSLPAGPIPTEPNRSFGGTLPFVPEGSFATISTLTANGQSALYTLWVTPSGQPPGFVSPLPPGVGYGISDEFAFYPDHSGPTDNVPEYALYLSGADITTGPGEPVLFAKSGTFIGLTPPDPVPSVAVYNALSPFWDPARLSSFDSSVVDHFEVIGTPVPEGPTLGLALVTALATLGLGAYRWIQARLAPLHR